ncbi:MAG TPA: hypothetical protein VEZ14_13485 [Dehalococcoidia bacterium]|nr:hypothetical protein [Dehalococcoidia bacterium]
MADFYMGSGDIDDLNKNPRACTVVREVVNPRGDVGLLVVVEPPLLGGKRYGADEDEVRYAVLATRHAGDTLVPISGWPLDVYVIRPRDRHPEALTRIEKETEYSIMSWGTLYPTREAALKDVIIAS